MNKTTDLRAPRWPRPLPHLMTRMRDHAVRIRALREQRPILTRHVQPARSTFADGYRLGLVVGCTALAMLGAIYLAGAL